MTPHEALCHPFFAPVFPFRWLVPDASDPTACLSRETNGEANGEGNAEVKEEADRGGVAASKGHKAAMEERAATGGGGAKTTDGEGQHASGGSAAPRKRERAR